MTPEQAITLCEMTAACCPQQRINEHTPDAWYALLGDLDFDDAREALVRTAKRQPFVAPAEIRDEVKAIRGARLANSDLAPPPDPDARDYTRQLQARIAALADGAAVPPAVSGGASDEPTPDYRQARAQAAPPSPAMEAPDDWCGRCDSQSRVRYQLTDDGTGLRAVPCPDCQGGRP